jgi:hypothetical protein
VGERERQLLGDELLDVRPLDVLSLLELNNAEDLDFCQYLGAGGRLRVLGNRTWMDLKRARWRAAMSA